MELKRIVVDVPLGMESANEHQSNQMIDR